MHEWSIWGPWYHVPTKLFGALHGEASRLLRDCLFWTTYNYQLSKFLELSVRRKLPNPSSEMDDDLDGIIRQAKALATLGSKIIHVFPPWNSIEIIPHATTHTVHYVIKDDSCGAHDINASTKYHSVKAILLNK